MKYNLIAEIGWNHMGKMDLACEMIKQASENGAKIAKFQTWKVSRLKSGEWDLDGRREIYEKAELSVDDHKFLMASCKEFGIEFMSSAFSIPDAQLLVDLGCNKVKIPSFEVANYKLLNFCKTNFEIVYVSTGTANATEIQKLADLFENFEGDLIVMHCVSAYPCEPSLINLPRISKLNNYFKNVGFSDHTQGILASFASLKYSPVAIEKHFTVDKNLPGRDNKFAILPKDLKDLSDFIELYPQFEKDNGLEYNPKENISREQYRGRFDG
tara:strand:- start:3909 stop:4718 length:810 start_codon:yes stop_codon:yes gene_type:complete